MVWHQRLMPPDSSELGAIVHGPVILARATNVVVALRSIVAFSTGLDLSIVAVAWGAESDAMKLEFTSPAEIDPANGRPHPTRVQGERLVLRTLDESVPQPLPHRSTEAFNQIPGSYRREYLFVIRPLPSVTELRLVTAWTNIGLHSTKSGLALPPLAKIREAIIPLA
ncbi:hypothetical protein [Rhodococcus sp. NPDC058521]|uniref:hypothetical protein n=1 Tax=Rhodococcus sp. NPDC058521 TaxID=3346536 RepID=UPI003661D3F3